MKDLNAPRRRLDELNYFNAIACLFVVLIHVLSLGITNLDKTGFAMTLVYLPWKFAAYVVPGFLFTGAVKMALGFSSDNGTPYLKYIWRRIVKIYIPYVIYVVLFFSYFVAIGWYKLDPKVLLHSIIYGDISSPFYYVVTVMQFYLLMPLWRFIVNKTPWFTALPTSALISFAMYRLDSLLGMFGIDFAYGDRVFPTYLFFWMLGLYAGKHYDKLYDAIINNKLAVLLCGLPAVLFSYMNYWQYKTGQFVYTIDANCMKLISDTLTILFFLCICIIIKNSSVEWLKQILKWIFGASFTVYLSHCLFLNFAERFIADAQIASIPLQLLIRFAVCYTVPFIWYFIISFVKTYISSLFSKK